MRQALRVHFARAQTYHGEMKTGQNGSFGIVHHVKMFGRRCKDVYGCLPRVIFGGNSQLHVRDEVQMGLALQVSVVTLS